MVPLVERGNNWQPRKCDNPWKPNVYHGQTEVHRRMMGILNKVTEQSIHILLPQALELPLCHPEHLSSILTLFLIKAQDEPVFTNTYALFCAELVKHLEIKEPLVEACWSHFSDSLVHLREYNAMCQLQNPNITMGLIQEEILARKRLVVHIAFVCCLERKNVVPFNRVVTMAETLLSHGDWRSIECLCRLLSFSGERFSASQQGIIERSCTELQNLLNGGSLSMRMTFLIEATLELRNNGWRRPPPAMRGSYGARTVRG